MDSWRLEAKGHDLSQGLSLRSPDQMEQVGLEAPGCGDPWGAAGGGDSLPGLRLWLCGALREVWAGGSRGHWGRTVN